MSTVLVTGSSGFIGGHLVKKLIMQNHFVIGVDIVQPRFGHPNIFYNIDLRNQEATKKIFGGNVRISEVYNLAACMGGMGFIGDEKKSYQIMIGSSQIVANVLEASIKNHVDKIFYSSSACCYNQEFQETEQSLALDEFMAYPAWPEMEYGWQKLFGERMHICAEKTFGTKIRIARFHNIYGPEGVVDGGKEKAPAAICRKVAQAKDGDEIEIWGDGQQTRSFLYIDECLTGIEKLMNSEWSAPLNIGSDRSISINDLAKMIIEISGKKLTIKNIPGNEGVRGRNSNNKTCRRVLGWEPDTNLEYGIKKLYSWVEKQIQEIDEIFKPHGSNEPLIKIP